MNTFDRQTTWSRSARDIRTTTSTQMEMVQYHEVKLQDQNLVQQYHHLIVQIHY